MAQNRFDYDSSDIHLSYDTARRLPEETMQLWMTEIRDAVSGEVGTIIDLGCGTGRFSIPLRVAFGAHVIGIDPSEQMLRVAREAVADERISFVQGSAVAMPVQGPVSMVFMSMCYHYFQHEMDGVRAELARVVAKEGHVVVRNTTKEDIELLSMFDFFPEARQTSLERMPSEQAIVDSLIGPFTLARKKRVVQRYAIDREDYVAKVGRRGLSSLKMLPDEQFHEGMARLKRHMETATDVRDLLFEGISLFVFRRS
jgi:SAM-dependent methyltransferase